MLNISPLSEKERLYRSFSLCKCIMLYRIILKKQMLDQNFNTHPDQNDPTEKFRF